MSCSRRALAAACTEALLSGRLRVGGQSRAAAPSPSASGAFHRSPIGPERPAFVLRNDGERFDFQARPREADAPRLRLTNCRTSADAMADISGALRRRGDPATSEGGLVTTDPDPNAGDPREWLDKF